MLAAQTASISDALKNTPLVIYGTMLLGFLTWLASVSETLQKVLGPVGRRLAARQARRAAQIANPDPRVTDLQGQVDHLAPRLETVERRFEELYSLVVDHQPWDWETLAVARRVDPLHPRPPTLRPRTWTGDTEKPSTSTDEPR